MFLDAVESKEGQALTTTRTSIPGVSLNAATLKHFLGVDESDQAGLNIHMLYCVKNLSSTAVLEFR